VSDFVFADVEFELSDDLEPPEGELDSPPAGLALALSDLSAAFFWFASADFLALFDSDLASFE